MSHNPVLDRTLSLASRFLASLPERPVGAVAGRDELLAALGGPLPDAGLDALRVIEELARGAERGLVASSGPRYFGFVIGGSHPAALAADWLACAWDQNAGIYATSPAAAVVEEVAAGWLLDLFGLPKDASVGFVTGGQMANFTCLAAARHAVLERAGWDVEERGLHGAPELHVVVGEEAHVTIFVALKLLGLGAGRVHRVAADREGRMRPEDLSRVLSRLAGPTIVCAQAGNVNSGSFDAVGEIAPLTRARGAWLHVDGAFGLWAAASPELRRHAAGLEQADSWSTDAHKWLNVPYDSGVAITAHPAAHQGAMTARASYLATADPGRHNLDWTPEFSRRARGFAVYAALRALGRQGVAELIERCSRHARRMAAALGSTAGIRILNEVVLNQVLVRFEALRGGDSDAFTRAVIAGVQADGTCWLGGTRWHEAEAMRVSICGWSTSDADIDRSAAAILAVRKRLAEATGAE
jgi:glutamate/tyrosine decarboxylase-like PLP-dependent enzyme